jgi:adenylosuccinate synthase
MAVVLGAQWGDEGKGKLVDILAQNADLCCRFNGGANAGHTLVVGKSKYAFHLLPCGMINKSCMNLIGNGVVVHIPTMMKELDNLKAFDPVAINRLFISSRYTLNAPTPNLCPKTSKKSRLSAKIGCHSQFIFVIIHG